MCCEYEHGRLCLELAVAVESGVIVGKYTAFFDINDVRLIHWLDTLFVSDTDACYNKGTIELFGF